jgi:hypothetical protein
MRFSATLGLRAVIAEARGGYCDTRSHVVSVLVKEVWLMPET